MKKSSNTIQKNEGLVDVKSQQAVQWFSKFSLKSIDSSKLWSKVEHQLENMDKKLLSWFMAMATSFTLLVAAGLEYGDELDLFEGIQEIDLSNNDAFDNKSENHTHKDISFLNQEIFTQELQSKKPFNNSSLKAKKLDIKQVLPEQSKGLESITQRSKQSIFNPNLSFSAEVRYRQQSFSPGISIDFQILQIQSPRAVHSFHLGWDAMLTNTYSTNTEVPSSSKYVSHFVKIGYDWRPVNKNGWRVESGYLINPDGTNFENTTIKMSVMKNITPHLRCGPEVIFTDNFSKSIPSFSLVVSS